MDPVVSSPQQLIVQCLVLDMMSQKHTARHAFVSHSTFTFSFKLSEQNVAIQQMLLPCLVFTPGRHVVT